MTTTPRVGVLIILSWSVLGLAFGPTSASAQEVLEVGE